MRSKILQAIHLLAAILIIFIYVFFFNRFHLIHAEQMQLFRFDPFFASNIFALPGGLSVYISQFLVQFSLYPLAGTFLFLLLSGLLYLLFRNILSVLNFAYPYVAFIPLAFFTAFQGNHDYHLETTVAYLLMLLFFYIYLKIKKPMVRYAAMVIFPPLAFITGGAAGLYLSTVILLYEILNIKRLSFYILLNSLTSILFIYLTCILFYTCPSESIHTTCMPAISPGSYPFVSYIVLLMLLPSFILFAGKRIRIGHHWIFKAAVILFLFVHLFFSYDYKTEKLFEIEHSFTEEDYPKVVSLAEKYPGNNHLVVYLGNIALSKTSQMGDKLFHLRQMFGPEGLFMKNEPVNVATLYGGELYEELKYVNEAGHWYFNGVISNGLNPVLLKHLAVCELVNGNYHIARKYISILAQTLFYRDWAKEYSKFVKSPLLIVSDETMGNLRKYAPYKDFYHDHFDSQLKSLLALYPSNGSAFSYLMAYALLRKDIKSFMDYLPYLKNIRYSRLPVHFEEALLVCKSMRPEMAEEVDRFAISEDTRNRFDMYVSLFESAGNNPEKAYKMLAKDFRNTFWFYLDFIPYSPSEEEANVQLFPY